MIRKFLIPAACAALLGGCVTGYGYSDGGYYYGRPSSSIRYYGGTGYGYPYGYDYGYNRYGYGSPYGYGGYYGGYYPRTYYPRNYRGHYCGDGHRHEGCRRPGGGGESRGDRDGKNGGTAPWRRWTGDRDRDERIQRRTTLRQPTPMQPTLRTTPQPQRPSRATVERPAMPRMIERRPAQRMMDSDRQRNRQERDRRRVREP